MAKVPTILAGGMASGGSTGPTASPGSFGADMSGLMGGLNKVQQAGDAIGERKFSMQMKLAQLDEMRYLNEAESHIKKSTSQFLADPANQANEDAPNIYQKMMDETTKDLVSRAKGNPELAMKIENMAGDYTSRAYDHLVAKSAGLKASRTAVSIIENNQVNLQSGAFDHESTLVKNFKKIDEAYAAHPEAAAKLKEQLVRDSVLFLANSDPERARAILDGSKEVDGPTRHTLTNVINTSEKVKRSVESDNWTRLTKDVVTGLLNSSMPPPDGAGLADDPYMQPDKWNQLFGKEIGPRKYEEWKHDYLNAITVNRHWAAIASMPPRQQMKAINSLFNDDKGSLIQSADPSGNTDRVFIRQSLMQHAGRSMNYLSTNGAVSWLQRYNDTASAMKNAKDMAGNTWTQDQQRAYLDTLVRLQSTEDGGMGRANPSLMSKEDATSWVSRINESKNPDEVLQVVNGLAHEFPTPEHLSIALRDLDSLPDTKISGNWRFLIQNKDKDWVRGYADAIMKYKETSKVSFTGDNAKTLDTDLAAAVKPWAEAFGITRIKDASDLMEATKVYAAWLMQADGKPNMTTAMKTAVKNLTSTLRPVEVNGYKTAAPAETPSSADNVLQHFTKAIDITKIDQTPFDSYLSDKSPKDKPQLVADAIAKDGHFQLSSDGKSFLLVIPDKGGALTSIRDLSGKPLHITMEDLNSIHATYDMPVFGTSVSGSGMAPIGVGVRGTHRADYSLRSSNFYVRP